MFGEMGLDPEMTGLREAGLMIEGFICGFLVAAFIVAFAFLVWRTSPYYQKRSPEPPRRTDDGLPPTRTE